MGSVVLTFIGLKRTNKHPDTPAKNIYIEDDNTRPAGTSKHTGTRIYHMLIKLFTHRISSSLNHLDTEYRLRLTI